MLSDENPEVDLNQRSDENITEHSKTVKKEPPPFFSSENLRSLAFFVICIFAIRSSIVAPYQVPTASMEPTIKVGDRILANKLAYGLKIPFTDLEVLHWADVKRGDIIVFKFPRSPDTDYVKRVVAIAGDKVKVVDNLLHVNNTPVDRVEHNNDRSVLDDIDDKKDNKNLYKETLDKQQFYVMQDINGFRGSRGSNWPLDGSSYTVPENSVFVMGDNRDNSLDSRAWLQVPMEYVRGKAEIVLWSAYSPRLEKGWDVRWYRFFSSLYL